MSEFKTVFGSLENYEKGHIEIIDDDPKAYAFSNIFEVANQSAPYEKVVVGKNLKYVIETLRAEGDSDWYTCAHVPVGYTVMGKHGSINRRGIDQMVSYNSWR